MLWPSKFCFTTFDWTIKTIVDFALLLCSYNIFRFGVDNNLLKLFIERKASRYSGITFLKNIIKKM